MRKAGISKRILSFTVSVIMVASMMFSGSAAAFSESGEENRGVKAGGAKLHLNGGHGYGIQSESGASDDDSMEDTVLVMLKDGTRSKTKSGIKKALSNGTEAVADVAVQEVWEFDGPSDMSLQSEDGASADEGDAVVAQVTSEKLSADRLAAKLNKRDDVEVAEKNVRIHACSMTNDAYSDYQWSMQSKDNAPNIEYEWKGKGVTGSDEKIVAVCDSGIDYTHPDLKDNMWVNTHKELRGVCGYDFIDGDADPMDDNEHGTHCAGIIGAVGNNRIGVSGVNHKIRLMALKILDSDGSAWLSHEIAAYNYINKALDLGEPVVAINNSWGGGEESAIFAKLIDIVGSKGAATICAAGNSGADIDEEPDYPLNIDSQYMLSVAATGTDGKLATYSNYGESVDIAAPGSNILSTVPQNEYNPTIYGDKRADTTAKFNDMEDAANKWGTPVEYYINGVKCTGSAAGGFTGPDGQRITLERVQDGFLDPDGHSIKATFTGMKADDLAVFTIPYETEDGAKLNPAASVMAKSTAPKSTGFGYPIIGIGETDGDTVPDISNVDDMEWKGVYVYPEQDDWDHLFVSGNSELKAGEERKFFVMLYAAEKGSYTVQMDDIGLSRQDIKEDDFGRYAFMSGTSMAAPFITGAVALKVVEKEKQAKAGESVDIQDILNEMSAMAKEEPELKIGPKGSFDFRLVPDILPPRIGSVSVDIEKGIIKIAGSGLSPEQAGFKVEIGRDEDSLKRAEVISGSSDEVLIRDNGWINNVETIRVTGAKGKQSLKRNLYLTKGKKEYTEERNLSYSMSQEAWATDGKSIYNVASTTREITAFDPAKGESSERTVAQVDPSKLFDIERDPNAQYGMLFGKDLVYANGYLYSVIEYGEADEAEIDDDDDLFFFRKGPKAGSSDDDDPGVDDFEGPFSIYSGDYKLIRVKASADDDSSAVQGLGKLPEDLEKLTDYTMAAYNGRIWFMGGYIAALDGKQLSDKVFIYDPASKKWSEGPSLPSPRAGGKALQSGKDLIYTLGISNETKDDPEDADEPLPYPDNLIYEGGAWRACGVKNKAARMYAVDTLDVGLTAKGLLYTGAPVFDLGDTFIYDKGTAEYVDTGYNYLNDPEEYGVVGFAVGNKFYGSTDDGFWSMPIESGLMTVKASKKGKGTIKGAGSYVPGNNAKITVKASKKYYIKSLKIGGRKIKLKKKAAKKTYTIKKITSNQTVKAVFARKNKRKR